MKTEEIKEYTKKYMEFLDTYQYGDPLPSYVVPIESDLNYSDFVSAFNDNPNGMKRKSKAQLSDNTILRIFNHIDCEDYLAVVEYPDGRLSWSVGEDENILKAIYHARLPEEYAFSIVKEPSQDMSICILPKFITDSVFRNIPTNYDTSVGELEPMWTTPWFRSLFNNYLRTSSESIFTSNDEKKTIEDMKQILENNGLIYDLDLEASQLIDIDLKPEHGASYNKSNHKI